MVTDGKLTLTLEEAQEGGVIVTSPLDPETVTEAESVAEGFLTARDALATLNASRAKRVRTLREGAARADFRRNASGCGPRVAGELARRILWFPEITEYGEQALRLHEDPAATPESTSSLNLPPLATEAKQVT